MNKKNTSHLTFKDDEDWSTKQLADNQERIQKYKVILKNLPAVQKYKIQKWQNKGVQSLSNLESIIENSLETDLEFIDSDVLDDNLDTIDHIRKLDQNKNILNQTNQYRSTELNNEISTISNLSIQQLDNNLLNQNRLNSNNNYQSNLNNFANLNLPKELNKKSNYKQINNDSNYFFGPVDQDYESRKTRERTSKNRLINRRQNVCDYMTIFLIATAFIAIFLSIILLFLIALNAWSMSTTFTIILIMLCILTVLLVLFASFTANFVWFFNSNSNSIDWMLSYGRKRNDNDSNYYFGKSFNKNNQDQENNDTESSLIQQI